MKQSETCHRHRNLDGLRLLGLSRIPRCASCPRLESLKLAYERGAASWTSPAIPAECVQQVCSPLVARLEQAG
jgi:hypothetical protein